MRVNGHAALLPLLSCLVLGAPGSDVVAHGSTAKEDHLWEELLEAALDKTAEGQQLVKRTAESPPSELLGELAQVLLEEWALPPTADELRQPRIVHAPKPDFSELFGSPIPPVKSSVVVATGGVTPVGTVENVQLKIATGVEAIDERCLEAFKQWRYRPARGKDRYVRSKVGATCHINLQ